MNRSERVKHKYKALSSIEHLYLSLFLSEPGHANGHGSKAKLRTQLVFAVKENKLYVCDQGNGGIRAVNLGTLFCHTFQIAQGDSAESESEEQDCAFRRIRKLYVHDLSLISEANVPDLVSPFAICSLHRITLNCLYGTFVLATFFQFPMLWTRRKPPASGS